MKTVTRNNTSWAKKSRRILWLLPFVIGGSLWAAIETHRYYSQAADQQAKPVALPVIAEPTANAVILAEADPASPGNSGTLVEDSITDEDAGDELEMETITLDDDLAPMEGEDDGIQLDLDDSDADEFLTVEEILSEDVDQIDAAEETETPPEEEEFVNLNEILYGTTDEEEIQEIKAQEAGIEAPTRQSLETEMQALKEKVLEINRDLFVLEEDLLFPSSTQVNVFVSFDAAEYFALDGVTLKIDDRPISNHLYTKRELKALDRGAVQRLFTGNLPTGDHELVAVVTGVGPEGRDYRRAISLDFAKSSGTKYIELKIVGDDLRKQPIFQLKEWD